MWAQELNGHENIVRLMNVLAPGLEAHSLEDADVAACGCLPTHSCFLKLSMGPGSDASPNQKNQESCM